MSRKDAGKVRYLFLQSNQINNITTD